jgi:hypothetical protein
MTLGLIWCPWRFYYPNLFQGPNPIEFVFASKEKSLVNFKLHNISLRFLFISKENG